MLLASDEAADGTLPYQFRLQRALTAHACLMLKRIGGDLKDGRCTWRAAGCLRETQRCRVLNGASLGSARATSNFHVITAIINHLHRRLRAYLAKK